MTPDTDNATHIVEVAGGKPGIAYVAWLADNAAGGYAEYLRRFFAQARLAVRPGHGLPPVRESGHLAG